MARKTTITQDDTSSGFKVEKPGKYFAPFGGLIPAAGRLLLAIAETLFRERGISYCYCDTDSLCPARLINMSREEFRKRVLEGAGPDGWFQPLSPYQDGEPIFALEDVNYRLLDDTSGEVGSELEPLYCLAISAKRYVLFNIIDNKTVIRKISGHGLGALRQMDDYDPSFHELTAPEHVAAPVDKERDKEARRLEAAFVRGDANVTAEDVRAAQRGVRNYGALVHGSTPRMLCDIWRIVVDCFRNGTRDKIDDIISALPQLDIPQYTQLTLSSSHLMKLYPNLPNKRGFQFFATFPAPKCRVKSKYVRGVPFDEHKALCGTTLYASVPPEGVTPELIEEWKNTKTGIFRRDNNEFPHGLFDPAWRLKLQTVADKLRGYFYHGEIKSSGDVGQLRRKVVVSLDKHFIGKETSPLDDDNEDTQDDTPITTSSDLVLRSADRNLQPVMDVEIENDAVLAGAFSKLKRDKRLTFDDMKELKANLELRIDGTLEPRYLKMETEADAANDPSWALRIKTWEQLKRFGRFEEIAKLSNIPLDDLDFAARYGDYRWNGGSNGDENLRCQNHWAAIQTAIDTL